MSDEEYLDHIALATLTENLRKATHPMSNIEPYRLSRLAYETATAMLEQRKKFIKDLDEQKIKASYDLVNLNLTPRTIHALMADGIYTVDQLTQCSENQVLRIPNLGRKMLNEIKAGLLANELKLKDRNVIAAKP